MNSQSTQPNHNQIYCFVCKKTKYPHDFSSSQFKKATEGNLYRSSTYIRQHKPTCKKCTAPATSRLTCKHCDKSKPSTEFSKKQRKSEENACCLKCFQKLQKEDLSDYDDSDDDSYDDSD
ncbi:hypothetical protein K7432_006204 [Basidiobolus ranarum]|uniref:Stc1 domain-containing protein n=1 Tax=Basidiobolus ranarum TaxID=34480 RepID=A0ABR2W204_9FUNG